MIVSGLDWPNESVQAPDILAYGDSWFDYPIPGAGSLLIAFDRAHDEQELILSRAMGGNEMIVDVMSTSGRRDMRLDFQGFGRMVTAIVVSGGGNDFTGENGKYLTRLLRADCSGASTAVDCFDAAALAARMDEIVAAYGALLALRDRYAPTVPLFAHTYDYAWPSGKGLLWLGPWLLPALEARQVPAALHDELVNALIDRFHIALTRLQGPSPESSGFHLVDLTYTLAKEHWANELHPTPEGFRRLGQRFANQFESVFV